MDMIVPTQGRILQGLDLSSVPSPCTVIDLPALEANARILARVRREAGVKVLAALKAFATWKTFPTIAPHLDGTCASGAIEARLGRERFGGEVHAFSPGYGEHDLAECLDLCDHLVFNSFSQWRRFRAQVAAAPRRISCGLRINPEHGEVEVELYNPCAAGSRLGIRRAAFAGEDLDGIEGLHFHTMCEQGPDVLERTLAAVEARFGDLLPRLRWLNCGGGHHITNPQYDVDHLIRLLREFRARHPHLAIYLEPGEAVAIGTGALVATVMDVVQADVPIAILDCSATAHMPDVLEMPYRPDVWGAGEPGTKAVTVRLAGNSCLAGDVIGDVAFDAVPAVGSRIVFGDMAHYTTVKTTMFNGVRLPALATWDGTRLEVLRIFGYADYEMRLS